MRANRQSGLKLAPLLRRLGANARWAIQGRALPHLSLEQRVRGKLVLITGASSGIGAASAQHLAGAGARLVLVARSEEKLHALVDELRGRGADATAMRCDISDLDDCDRLCNRVIAELGSVDVLVNNAGRSIRRSVLETTDRFHDYQRTMQLNYFGAIRIAINLLPAMIRNGGGQIINISTLGVQTGVPRFSAYLGSKFALEGWTLAAQNELAHKGIDFTLINFPLVRTPMIAPTRLYDRMPALSRNQAAQLVCDAIIRRPKRIVPASGLVAAGMNYLLPRTTETLMNLAYQMVPESVAKIAFLDEERAARRRATTGPQKPA